MVEGVFEVLVVEGAIERLFGVQGEAHDGCYEAADGGFADDEGLLRHHVETIARVVVRAFEIEQARSDACAFERIAHQNQQLRRAIAQVEELADALDDGRLLRVVLDADIPFVGILTAWLLRGVVIGILQRVAQRVGYRAFQVSARYRFVELVVHEAIVQLHDAFDDAVVETNHLLQTAEVLLEVDDRRILLA